jgi:hypothetical protein
MSESNSNIPSSTVPSWTNRRKVVKYSLLTFGLIFIIISLSAVFCLVWTTVHPVTVNIPSPISNILVNILWVIGIAYMAIVGSYVFGAQWDITSFRKFISTYTSNLLPPANPPNAGG